MGEIEVLNGDIGFGVVRCDVVDRCVVVLSGVDVVFDVDIW